MDTSATLPADLADLSAALDNPRLDVETELRAFTAGLKLAVGSYVGMTITIVVNEYQVSFSAYDEAVGASFEMAASRLLIPLGAIYATSAGGTLLLYAATPGAFVDLAADLTYALGIDRTDLVLDDHIAALPDGPGSAVTGLDGHALINRAIGVLVDRGHTPESAGGALRRLSRLNGGKPHLAAGHVLRSIPAGVAGYSG